MLNQNDDKHSDLLKRLESNGTTAGKIVMATASGIVCVLIILIFFGFLHWKGNDNENVESNNAIENTETIEVSNIANPDMMLPDQIDEQTELNEEMSNLYAAQRTKINESLISAQLSCARTHAQQRQQDALAKAEADKKAQMAALSRSDVSYVQPIQTVTPAISNIQEANNVKTAAVAQMPALPPDTIEILGAQIPFIDAYGVTRAPEHGAGVWKGNESTTDGQFCYFVGHNPGDFHNVMDLKIGDVVTVCDTEGRSLKYTVRDIFDVPQKSPYSSIQGRVEGHGESIVMQTCIGDGNVRVVVAY